jgi:hypothetical protein
MKTLYKTMTPLNIFHLLDKNSLALCASSIGLKLGEAFLFAPTALSSAVSYVAIVAGISTLLYNAIRIYKELNSRK